MPKEAAMTRTALLARCSAAAATATLLAGLAAAPAMARPDPGEPTTQQSQVSDGSTKAQIDHNERLLLDGRTKAQIEHEEALSSVPSTDGDVVSAPADEFPWAVASFAATGLAAVAAGGVVMLRQRRSVPQPA
jgi:predicted acyltransferase